MEANIKPLPLGLIQPRFLLEENILVPTMIRLKRNKCSRGSAAMKLATDSSTDTVSQALD